MIAEIAKQFHAEHRGNCAMSVAYAFAKAKGLSEEEAIAKAQEFQGFGGGRAPEGLCGALYAAQTLNPDKKLEIEKVFKEGAKNCTHCKEIRPNAIIPCNSCVELAGCALDKVNK